MDQQPGPLRRRVCFCRRHHVLVGTLIVAIGYTLADIGWRDSGKAVLVYALGAFALSSPRLPARLRAVLVIVWRFTFVADLGIRALLLAIYQTKPDTVLVVEAVSNTTSEESLEFLMQSWHTLAYYLSGAALLAALLTLVDAPYQRAHLPGPKTTLAVAILFIALHANPTFRKSDPLYFWPSQIAQVHGFQQNVEQLRAKRDIARGKLADWSPNYVGPLQHTVGIVIGESTSRWDWQLYGYARDTTPVLQAESADLMVFKDVIAATSGTVSSFRYMLTPMAIDQPMQDEEAPSVLMLARAAGYKIFWISNQHDRYINPRFAEEADVQKLLNVGGRRGDRHLDETLIPEWIAALHDPAPRKLIVVHLLGAHPHYDLRYPDAFRHYGKTEDVVSRELKSQGRMPWIRAARDQYDNAMLYQDSVIGQLLNSFKQRSGNSGAFLYTSDHAQEVGHTRNFAGHSAEMPGLVVPLLVWMTQPPPADEEREMEQRPFQNDVLDWTLLDLLDIKTHHDQPQLSLLDAAFQPRIRRLQSGKVRPGGTDPDDLPVVP
jgi:heptose-I-phosphate ethanolaminephosphotransferase